MAEPAAGHEHPSPFLKRRRDIPRCFGLTEARNHGVERAVDELQGCRVHQMKLKSYEPRLGGTLRAFFTIFGEVSIPTTRPVSPTRRAAAIAADPVAVPTSRTESPGFTSATSRSRSLMRAAAAT